MEKYVVFIKIYKVTVNAHTFQKIVKRSKEMSITPEKIQELIVASHVIAYEGYYHTLNNADGEMNALFRTIIHLLSKAITKEGKKE